MPFYINGLFYSGLMSISLLVFLVFNLGPFSYIINYTMTWCPDNWGFIFLLLLLWKVDHVLILYVGHRASGWNWNWRRCMGCSLFFCGVCKFNPYSIYSSKLTNKFTSDSDQLTGLPMSSTYFIFFICSKLFSSKDKFSLGIFLIYY